MRLTLLCGFCGLAVAVAACNTDPIWEPSQRVEAPVTSIDSPEGVAIPDLVLVDAGEVDLVERVLMHRAMYHRSLEALHDFYREHGYDTKRRWTEKELADVARIKPFRYVMSGEVATDRLRPTDSIPEADALYEQGLSLMREGGHSVPVLYREAKMRDALKTFRDLIEHYPSSDKIDDAAFQSGEIHREYFKGEELIAIRWYERAFAWDPDTPHPARFQAAAIYDLRLHDRDRALELYQDVLRYETEEQSNVRFAVRRIEQLTRDLQPDVGTGETAKSFSGQQTTSPPRNDGP